MSLQLLWFFVWSVRCTTVAICDSGDFSTYNGFTARPQLSLRIPIIIRRTYRSPPTTLYLMAATAGLAVVDTRTSGINRGGGLTNRLVAGGSLAHVFG